MTPVLRKRHRQIWLLLAFLLPIFCFFAWRALPQPPAEERPLPPEILSQPQ